MKKIIKYFSLVEWLLYILSLLLIIISFIVFKNENYFYLIGSIVGISALIFVSKGNVIGQVITVIFSIFYGIISYSFKYYGEMITYLCMTTPIAIASVISWLKNPYSKNEVKVNNMNYKEYIVIFIISIIVTVIFYFILKVLNTANLTISTLSVTSSFLAVTLTMKRSRFYAIAYAINDIVLIVLWILASITSKEYISMIVCFVAFLAFDLYGFINWSRLQIKQNKK